MKKFYIIGGAIVVFGLLVFGFNPKRPMATDYPRTITHAMSSSEATSLKAAIAPALQSHKGESGFELLGKGDESLVLRIAMVQAAERTLDIQYYIMQNDMTGKLLLEAILRAADRGVRVRILMDDLNLRGRDKTWPLLNVHKNIEIRIFNPFATRDEPLFTRISNVFTGLGKFSKRMHNKILVADNQIAITGGRNVGDSYFDASGQFNFRDADVAVIGGIVNQLSESFDKYWNDDESFPISVLHKPGRVSEEIHKLRDELKQNWHKETTKTDVAPSVPLAQQLATNAISFVWAKAELAADDPSKIDLPKGEVVSKPAKHLKQIAAKTQHEIVIVTPYFVPGEERVKTMGALIKDGVNIKVLTNSLASTDAVAAHNGYRKYRKDLVKEGVELYEMKPIPGAHPRSQRFSSSSRNSLHSKIYIFDRKDVVIGSFNLDPRSISLNTEMVLIIHSAELAKELLHTFERAIAPTTSYRIAMQDGSLQWLGEDDGKQEVYYDEPEVSFWRTVKVNLLALLPVESQL